MISIISGFNLLRTNGRAREALRLMDLMRLLFCRDFLFSRLVEMAARNVGAPPGRAGRRMARVFGAVMALS